MPTAQQSTQLLVRVSRLPVVAVVVVSWPG